MRHAMKLTLTFLLAASVASARANGGGYASGVKYTGSVAPFQPEGCEKVQIVKEHLDILLGEKSAAVTVRYEMQNVSGDTAKVRFGFPVEAVEPMVFNVGPRPGPLSYCRNYSVNAGGRTVKSEYAGELFSEGKIPAFPGSEAFQGIKGWMVSEVKFPAGKTTAVEIRYDSDYDHRSVSVSDSGTVYPHTFRYRLSTGAVWHGPIAEGTVRVRLADGLNAAPVTIKAPANKFKKHPDGGWEWKFKDLEPTLADDITVETTEETYSTRDYTEGAKGVSEGYERVGKKWYWQHLDYSVTASSALKSDGENKYDATGVKDKDGDFRAWVEGKDDDGIGESLTITQREATPVAAIYVRPGFGKSKQLFTANNRPKALKVTVNGKHTFTAALKDEDSFQRILLKDFTGAVKTIRLEIAEVYRGTGYRDTAIGHVSLLRPLSKEPKFTGPR